MKKHEAKSLAILFVVTSAMFIGNMAPRCDNEHYRHDVYPRSHYTGHKSVQNDAEKKGKNVFHVYQSVFP